MSRHLAELDDLELGRRVGLHLIIENDLPHLASETAITCRLFLGTHSKDRTDD